MLMLPARLRTYSVAQRTAIMEANFMGRSLVAKNVKLIIAVFETLIL